LNETKRFSEADIDEILADHEEMIREALASGLAENDITNKFGDAAKVAADLAADACGRKRTEERGNRTESQAFAGVPPSGALTLTFKLASEDLSVVAEDRSDLVVTCKGNAPLSRYEIGFDGHEFRIKRIERDASGWFRRGSMSFDVRVPASTVLEDVVLQAASGDYVFTSLRAKSLKVNTASGDGCVDDGSFDSMKIASVNGDLRLDKLIAGDIAVVQVSGDLSVSHLVGEGTIQIVSTSGDVQITDSTCVDAVFHTVSGDLEGKEFYPETIEIRGISGDVDIDNADKTRPIRVKSTKSISGTIRIRQ